jgi:hypothetical protein
MFRKRLFVLLVAVLVICAVISIVIFFVWELQRENLRPADILSTESLLRYAELTGESSSPPDITHFLSGEKVVASYRGESGIRSLLFERIRSRRDRRALQALVGKEPFQDRNLRIVGLYLVSGEGEELTKILEPHAEHVLSRDPRYELLFLSLPREASMKVLLSDNAVEREALVPLFPFFGKFLEGLSAVALSLHHDQHGLQGTIVSQGNKWMGSIASLPTLEADPLRPLLFAATGVRLQEDLASVISTLSDGIPSRDLILRGALEAAFHRTVSQDAHFGSLLALMGDAPYTILVHSGSGRSLRWGIALEDTDGGSEEILEGLQKDFSARFQRAQVRAREFPPGRTVRDVLPDPALLKEEEWTEQGFTVTKIASGSPREELFFARGEGAPLAVIANDEMLLRAILKKQGAPFQSSYVHREFVLDARGLSLLTPLLEDAPFFQLLKETLGEAGIVHLRESARGSRVT